jgi:hypothetical protein
MITDEDLLVKKDPVSWWLLLSICTHLVSFFLPTLCYGSGVLYGWEVFVVGLIATCEKLLVAPDMWSLPCLASPAYWIGIWMLAQKRYRVAKIAMIAAFVVGLSFPVVIWRKKTGESLGMGYYLWLSSLLISMIVGIIAWRRSTCSHSQNDGLPHDLNQ